MKFKQLEKINFAVIGLGTLKAKIIVIQFRLCIKIIAVCHNLVQYNIVAGVITIRADSECRDVCLDARMPGSQ